MIIIPELETVLLQPPRTGTTSIREAVLKKYPKAFAPYRHMEYAGIPVGYERWRVVCQVRNPYQRMVSLFNYMKNPEVREDTDPVWIEKVKAETTLGFSHWLRNGSFVFANPAASDAKPFRPRHMCLYPLPEQQKSQSFYGKFANSFLYFENLALDAEKFLNIDAADIPVRGSTDNLPYDFSVEDIKFMYKWHAWDIFIYSFRQDYFYEKWKKIDKRTLPYPKTEGFSND